MNTLISLRRRSLLSVSSFARPVPALLLFALTCAAGCAAPPESDSIESDSEDIGEAQAALSGADILHAPPPEIPDPTSTPNETANFLFASLGDSYGSGEGSPEVPGQYSITGELEGTSVNWSSAYTANENDCHRSPKAGSVLAIKALASAWPAATVVYTHLACSGATSWNVSSTTYGGVNDTASPAIASQRDQVWSWMVQKGLANSSTGAVIEPLDAVYVSAGGNDAGFADIATACILDDCADDASSSDPWASSTQAINDLNDPGGAFETLHESFLPLVSGPSALMITKYPDLGLKSSGQHCTGDEDALHNINYGWDDWLSWIDQAEWDRVVGSFLNPLNTEISATSSKFGWTVLSGASTKGHSVCDSSSARWFNINFDANQKQGSDLNDGLNMSNGMLHPNDKGHSDYYKPVIQSALDQRLRAKMRPSAPSGVRALSAGVGLGGYISVGWDDLSKYESYTELEYRDQSGALVESTWTSSTDDYFSTPSPGVYTVKARQCFGAVPTSSGAKECSAWSEATVANKAPTTAPTGLVFTGISNLKALWSAVSDPAHLYYDLHVTKTDGTNLGPYGAYDGAVSVSLGTARNQLCGATAKVRSCSLVGCGPYSEPKTVTCQ